MQSAIESQLNLTNVKILRSNILSSDQGKLFIKYGDKELVLGELESLRAIKSTETIQCPKPFGIVEKSDSYCIVTSFIDFQHGKDWKLAGNLIARMHRKNAENLATLEKNENFVGRRRLKTMTSSGSESEYEDEYQEEYQDDLKKFGFKVATCCGRLAQDNEWKDNWVDFFIQNRLKPQIDRIIETHSPRPLLNVADALYRTADKLLRNRRHVAPALVHGDLWGGNWSMAHNEPIVFDPSASFSDPEFEFGIMQMFGGWTKEFQDEYEKIMGVAEGKEQRVALYELYHNLNHWNHFGGSYQYSSMALIDQIIGK